MKIDGILCQLDEAREHLDSLIAELQAGRMADVDDSDLQVQIEHILDHLCFAWNGRHISVSDYVDLTQQDFERLWHTVPNAFGPRTLEPQ